MREKRNHAVLELRAGGWRSRSLGLLLRADPSLRLLPWPSLPLVRTYYIYISNVIYSISIFITKILLDMHQVLRRSGCDPVASLQREVLPVHAESSAHQADVQRRQRLHPGFAEFRRTPLASRLFARRGAAKRNRGGRRWLVNVNAFSTAQQSSRSRRGGGEEAARGEAAKSQRAFVGSQRRVLRRREAHPHEIHRQAVRAQQGRLESSEENQPVVDLEATTKDHGESYYRETDKF